MKAIKVYIDKSSLINHIPEEYKDCELIFVKVDNNIDHVEVTAIASNERADNNEIQRGFYNVRREHLILDDN